MNPHSTEVIDSEVDAMVSLHHKSQSPFARLALCNLAVGIFVLAITASALSGAFLFDDRPNIVENQSLRGSLVDSLRSTRPITTLSFALNYRWSGLDPVGFHWFNNCVHAAAACMLFLLVYETLKHRDFGLSAKLLPALCVAGIWSVHPLNTQAVTYLVQRGESLMGLAFFTFLWLLAKSAAAGKSAAWWLIPAFIILCVGLGSKQVMVMALPVGLLYDRVFLSNNWREVRLHRGWFWLATLILIGAAALAAIPMLIASEAGVGFQLVAVSPWEYLTTQPSVILHYFRLSLWPSPLIFDYGWPPEQKTSVVLLTSSIVLSLGIACSLSALHPKLHAWASWGFWPLATLLVLLPTSSIVPLQDLAVEHRMYVPLAFLMCLLVLSLFRLGTYLFHDKPVLVPALICLPVVCGFAAMTIRRNADYRTAIGMWEDVIAKTEKSGRENMLAGRAYSNLGEAYGEAERWDDSIRVLQLALEAGNFPVEVHGNLARAFIATHQLDSAVYHISQALEREPKSPRIRQQAGLLFVGRNDFPQAELQFRQALEFDPSDAIIMVNLAQTLLAQKKTEEAEKLFRKAITDDRTRVPATTGLIAMLAQESRFAEAEALGQTLLDQVTATPEHLDLVASVLAASGKTEQAVKLWEQAAISETPPKLVNFRLGNFYRGKGELPLAEKYYLRELNTNPECIDALNNLAGMTAQKNPQLAISYFEKVLERAPQYLQADFNIAALQANLGQTAEAIKRLEDILARQQDFLPARELLRSLQETKLAPSDADTSGNKP